MSTEHRTGPERPRHINPSITAIGTDDLAGAFGLTPGPGGDPSIATLRARITMQPPVWDHQDWARGARGTDVATSTLLAADRLVYEETDVTGAGRGRSELYGFHYLGWLMPLPRAFALTGRVEYADAFSRLLTAWERERTHVTGQWPGLDVTWYTLGCWARSVLLLPAVHTFGDTLDDDGWRAAMTTVLGGARWLADEHTAFRHGNWQTVGATQLLHATYVLPGLTTAEAWRETALTRLREHLRLDFYPDGGHYERSPGYHTMCLENLQIAAQADRQYGDGSLLVDPRFRQIHQWLATMTGDGGWAPAFQDSPVVWPGDLLLRGAWMLEDGDLLRAAAGALPEDALHHLVTALPGGGRWAREALGEGTPPISPDAVGTRTLADSGYTILRSATDGTRVTINHGPHIEHELESHSHGAALDLIVERSGTPLLWEAGGPPDYDVPDYRTWYQAPEGHDAVSVDGVPLSPERRVHGRSLSGAGFSVFLGGHDGFGVPLRRTVIMTSHLRPMIIVQDEADGSSTGPFTLRWHASSPWAPAGHPDPSTGTSGAWTSGSVTMLPDPCSSLAVEQLGQARVPTAHGHADFVPLSTLTSRNVTGTFLSILLPGRDLVPLPVVGAAAPADPVVDVGPEPTSDPRRREITVGDGRIILTRHAVIARSPLSGAGTACEISILGHDTGGHDLGDDAPFISPVPVDLTWQRRGKTFSGTVTTSERCTLALPSHVARLRLDGIDVEMHDRNDDHITLPYAGTWTVEGTDD